MSTKAAKPFDRITVILDINVKNKFQLKALKEKKSASEVIREMILEYIKRGK